jgi:hypothetical protein
MISGDRPLVKRMVAGVAAGVMLLLGACSSKRSEATWVAPAVTPSAVVGDKCGVAVPDQVVSGSRVYEVAACETFDDQTVEGTDLHNITTPAEFGRLGKPYADQISGGGTRSPKNLRVAAGVLRMQVVGTEGAGTYLLAPPGMPVVDGVFAARFEISVLKQPKLVAAYGVNVMIGLHRQDGKPQGETDMIEFGVNRKGDTFFGTTRIHGSRDAAAVQQAGGRQIVGERYLDRWNVITAEKTGDNYRFWLNGEPILDRFGSAVWHVPGFGIDGPVKLVMQVDPNVPYQMKMHSSSAQVVLSVDAAGMWRPVSGVEGKSAVSVPQLSLSQ